MSTIRSAMIMALLFGLLSACSEDSEPQSQTTGAGEAISGALKEASETVESEAEDAAESVSATFASLASKFTSGSCCAKAAKGGKVCSHDCCVEAAKAGEVCTKCNSG